MRLFRTRLFRPRLFGMRLFGATLLGPLLFPLLLAAAERPPNILFVLADDHTSQAWGCYGGRLAGLNPTPNIDRLASEGARLTNAFCTNSICSPSRASILTGRYSHLNGVRTLADALDPEADNVAKRLRAAGYQTALIGKWHLKSEPSGFDYWNIIRGQGRYHSPILFEGTLEQGETRSGRYSTDVFTDEALAWLDRRDRGRPFALMLHFKAAHEPWQYHPRYRRLYQNVEIPEPESLTGSTGPAGTRAEGWPLEILVDRMRFSDQYGGGRLNVDTQNPLEARRAAYQKLMKDYLRTVAGIDHNVGRVLDYLDRAGLDQDTVVIYTSDQGYFLGEHNYFDKRFMLEESLRMPFVVRYPREIEPGTVIDDITLNIDFALTFLDYAETARPESMQGRSFRENLQGRTPEDWRDAMYYRYYGDRRPQRPAHFGVRTRTHKLIYYYGLRDSPEAERWELYDLAEDPAESRNVYDRPEHGAVIAGLKRRLQQVQAEVGDRR